MKKVGIYGGAVYYINNSITTMFFALYAAQLGASTALIGLMLTIRSLLPLFLAMPSGQVIDRIGAPLALKFGCLATMLSLLLMTFSSNLYAISVSQLLLGASALLMSSSTQVLVAEGEKAERDVNITRYSAWSSMGTMSGPLLGGAVVYLVGRLISAGAVESGMEYRAVYLFTCLIILVYTCFVYISSRKVVSEPWDMKEMRKLFTAKEIFGSYLGGVKVMRHSGVQFGLIGTFLIHFLQSIWNGFLPLYLDGLGYSAIVISVLVSIRGAAGMFSRSFLRVLLKWMSQERLMIGAGCIAALCLIGLPLLQASFIPILLLAIVLGCATGVNMPVSTMIMADDTAENERGMVMGLRQFANRSSQIVAPSLFGSVGGVIGLGGAFTAGGGLLLVVLLGFGAYNHMSKKRKVQVQESSTDHYSA